MVGNADRRNERFVVDLRRSRNPVVLWPRRAVTRKARSTVSGARNSSGVVVWNGVFSVGLIVEQPPTVTRACCPESRPAASTNDSFDHKIVEPITRGIQIDIEVAAVGIGHVPRLVIVSMELYASVFRAGPFAFACLRVHFVVLDACRSHDLRFEDSNWSGINRVDPLHNRITNAGDASRSFSDRTEFASVPVGHLVLAVPLVPQDVQWLIAMGSDRGSAATANDDFHRIVVHRSVGTEEIVFSPRSICIRIVHVP